MPNVVFSAKFASDFLPLSNSVAFPPKRIIMVVKLVIPLCTGQEDPLEEGMVTNSGILPGESHGSRSLEGYSQ